MVAEVAKLMSTEIYQAVRVPIKKLNDYLALCNAQALKEFHREIDRYMACLDWKKIHQQARANHDKH